MLAWRLRKFRVPGVMREVTFKVMRRTLNTIRFAALLAGFGLVMAAAGCSSIPGASYVSNLAAKTFSPGRISHEELREALVQFAGRFEATIIATADTIAAGSKDPVMQRRTLRWKLGMTPVVNQAAFLPEPVSAYVGMLTLATSMQQYLATGSGREVFGEQQQLAPRHPQHAVLRRVTGAAQRLDRLLVRALLRKLVGLFGRVVGQVFVD